MKSSPVNPSVQAMNSIRSRHYRGVMLALLLAPLSGAPAENPFARKEELSLRSVTPNQEVVAQYGKLELTLDLRATYENPFDPREIAVEAVFTPPEGKPVRVSGFLYQPCQRRVENNMEKIEPTGAPVWKVRFTPAQAGRWKYEVFAQDRTAMVSVAPASFEVTKSDRAGFIRRGGRNPQGFVWDNGKPFFAVGENMCWAGVRGTYEFEEWLEALGQAGGNYIRVWMSSWNCALEWTEPSHGEWRSGNYHGLGCYSLDNAWKLDAIFEIAERNGINLMLCLGTYGEFNDRGYFNEGQWMANPYNAANGGPCAKPEDFWTNRAARRRYQQRLRYLAARYGYRLNLQSWEFWNEAKAPAAWVAEMARFLKGTGEVAGPPADPYGHLVSTTYGEDEVWKTPEIDFTQTHSYGRGDFPDHAPVLRDEALKAARYGKPHLTSEFGIDWRGPDAKYDPESKGLNLHNGLWASALSGDAGGAMIWWWDNYVHPKGLASQFGALRRFTDRVPWERGPWETLKAEVVAKAAPSGEKTPAAAKPAVNLYGLRNGATAVAWIQNAESHWKNAYDRKTAPVLRDVEIVLRDLPAGPYRLEWWDTWKGEVVRREEATATGAAGELRLKVPELATDVAVQVVETQTK